MPFDSLQEGEKYRDYGGQNKRETAKFSKRICYYRLKESWSIKPGRTWEVDKIKIFPLSGMAIPLNIYNLYSNKN